jgi:hypothetical protein
MSARVPLHPGASLAQDIRCLLPGGRAPFSLVFRGGPTPPLPQRIHRVEHAELGALEIFLVPVGPDRYEAVFT